MINRKSFFIVLSPKAIIRNILIFHTHRRGPRIVTRSQLLGLKITSPTIIKSSRPWKSDNYSTSSGIQTLERYAARTFSRRQEQHVAVGYVISHGRGTRGKDPCTKF